MNSDHTARRREIEDSTAARLAEIVAAAEKAAKQVIDEAEEDARTRISDAHEEADRIVAGRLAGLAELTDELGTQAAALAHQAEALQRALAEAKAELGPGAAPGASIRMGGRRASDPDHAAESARAPEFDPASEPARAAEPARTFELDRGSEPDSVSDPDLEQADEGPRKPAGPALTVVGAPTDDETGGEGEAAGTPAGARLLATQMAVSGSSREEIEARLRNGFAIADTRSILDAILGPEQ